MIRSNVRRTLLAATGLAVCATLVALGGPIDPPAGPVGPTFKTLSEVEPRTAINETNTPGDADSLFRIAAPGSYYLTGNITGVAGKHGIEVAANGVTIDLGGFDVAGAPGSLDGITDTPGLRNISILNGSIRNWGDNGVELEAIGGRVEGLCANGNREHGIKVNSGFTLRSCFAMLNGIDGQLPGFRADSGTTIVECTSEFNRGSGFQLGIGSVVTDCVAVQNEKDGITASSDTLITGCVVTTNFQNGIVVSTRCVLRDNLCNVNNGGAGILVTGRDNRVEGNTCATNFRGIELLNSGNVLVRNTCSGNFSNWNIVAGNAYGPIVVTSSGAAVSGDSAPGSLGSTDPNANFTY